MFALPLFLKKAALSSTALAKEGVLSERASLGSVGWVTCEDRLPLLYLIFP